MFLFYSKINIRETFQLFEEHWRIYLCLLWVDDTWTAQDPGSYSACLNPVNTQINFTYLLNLKSTPTH